MHNHGHPNAAYSGPSQFQNHASPQSPALPPGKNDLEILEKLKEIIKSNQHKTFTPNPQPLALRRLYIGPMPIPDRSQENGQSRPEQHSAQVPPTARPPSPDPGRRPPRIQKTENRDKNYPSNQSTANPSPGYNSRHDVTNPLDPSSDVAISTEGAGKFGTSGTPSTTVKSEPNDQLSLTASISGGPSVVTPQRSARPDTDTNPDQANSNANTLGSRDTTLSRSGPNDYPTARGSGYDSKDDYSRSRDTAWSHRDNYEDRRTAHEQERHAGPMTKSNVSYDSRLPYPAERRYSSVQPPPVRDDRFLDRDDRDRSRREWHETSYRDRRPYDRYNNNYNNYYSRPSDSRRPPAEQRHWVPEDDSNVPRRFESRVTEDLSVSGSSNRAYPEQLSPSKDGHPMRPVDTITNELRQPVPTDAEMQQISAMSISDGPRNSFNPPVSAPPLDEHLVKTVSAPHKIPTTGIGLDNKHRSASVSRQTSPNADSRMLNKPSLQDRLGDAPVGGNISAGSGSTTRGQTQEPIIKLEADHGAFEEHSSYPPPVPNMTASEGNANAAGSDHTRRPQIASAAAAGERQDSVRPEYSRHITPTPPGSGKGTFMPAHRSTSLSRGNNHHYNSMSGKYPPRSPSAHRPGRDSSRERAPNIYRPEPPLLTAERRPEVMDVDEPAPKSDTRGSVPPRRFSPPSAADLARDRERMRQSFAASLPPRGEGDDAPPSYDEPLPPHKRYSGPPPREWNYPYDRDREREVRRGREWFSPPGPSVDEQYWKDRGPPPAHWDRAVGPPPGPAGPLDKDRYDRSGPPWVRDRDRERDGYARESYPPDDRAYPPPVREFERGRGPPPGPLPSYNRIRQRSLSPPRRSGPPLMDDPRPPIKRPREDYPDYYPRHRGPGGPGPGPGGGTEYGRAPSPPPPPSSGVSSYYGGRSGPPPTSAASTSTAPPPPSSADYYHHRPYMSYDRPIPGYGGRSGYARGGERYPAPRP